MSSSSAVKDAFWDVQKVWEKIRDSRIAIENPEELPNASSPPVSEQDLSGRLLKLLAERESFDSYVLSQELGKDHQQVVGAIKSIHSLGEVSDKKLIMVPAAPVQDFPTQ